jgi:hypothetical protein
MALQDRQTMELPKPPKFPRRVGIYHAQLIGIPLLMAVPFLALLGMFGERTETVSVAAPPVEMTVEYPALYRFKMTRTMDVAVRNVSGRSIPSLVVAFQREYIDSFSQVSFTPQADTITGTAYEVQVQDLQPGETRHLSVDLRAEDYWKHRGTVAVSSERTELVHTPVETWVWP